MSTVHASHSWEGPGYGYCDHCGVYVSALEARHPCKPDDCKPEAAPVAIDWLTLNAGFSS